MGGGFQHHSCKHAGEHWLWEKGGLMSQKEEHWLWEKRELMSQKEDERQADFWVRGQPGLQSEFQDSQGYKENPSPVSRKKPNPKNKTKQKKNKQKKPPKLISLF